MNNYFKYLFIILGKKYSKIFYLIVALFTIGALLEILSLGLIIPIISILNEKGQGEIIFSFEFINIIFKYLNSFDLYNYNKIYFLLILFLIVFIVKTIFFSLLTYFNLKFCQNLYIKLSERIYTNYVSQNYNFYLKRSSSQLIKNITVEINNFITSYLLSILNLFSELIILFFISLLLISISFLSFFLIFFIFIISSFLFIFFLKKTIKKWSYEKEYHHVESLRYIQEGIRNIKDIKIYGLEKKFINYYNSHIKIFSKIENKFIFLGIIPRYFIELLGIVCLVLIVHILFFYDFSNNAVLVILSTFAASALKILPSINRIINYVLKIKYSHLSAKIILNEIRLKPITSTKNNNKKVNYVDSLELKNIFFRYNNNSNYVLENINIKIPFSKTIGIMGDSGSGKTTLIDLILGIIKPTKGVISSGSNNIHSNLRLWQNKIGYVQQSNYFIESSIRDNIALASNSTFIDDKRVFKCLDIVGLSGFINTLPKKIETNISELGKNLSGGQKQRISIARALYIDPSIIILDESTNALDEKSERLVIKNILSLKKNKTIIIISHKKEIINLCDVAIKIINKKIKIL